MKTKISPDFIGDEDLKEGTITPLNKSLSDKKKEINVIGEYYIPKDVEETNKRVLERIDELNWIGQKKLCEKIKEIFKEEYGDLK